MSAISAFTAIKTNAFLKQYIYFRHSHQKVIGKAGLLNFSTFLDPKFLSIQQQNG